MAHVPKIIFLLLAASFCFYSVQAQNKYNKFVYNGQNLNSLQTGREPEFGMGSRDGCSVKRKIFLEMHDIDSVRVEGAVKDGEDEKIVMPGVTLIFKRKNGHSDTTFTDTNGRFTIAKSSPLKSIEVRSIGYWPLFIKGSSKKLF